MVRVASEADFKKFTKLKQIYYKFPLQTAVGSGVLYENEEVIYTAEEDAIVLGVSIWRGIPEMPEAHWEHQVMVNINEQWEVVGFINLLHTYIHNSVKCLDCSPNGSTVVIAPLASIFEDIVERWLLRHMCPVLEEDENIFASVMGKQDSGAAKDWMDVNVKVWLLEKP